MLDVHSHVPENRFRSIYSLVPPRGFCPEAGVCYSLGIHPWVETEFRQGLFCSWEELEALAARPEVCAVGEAGLDRLHRPLPDVPPGCLHEVQAEASAPEPEAWRKSVELLERQARLAERVGKPLVLHCVKAVDDILALQGRLRPQVPWIFHGFRGNPQQACQLVRRGICLSLGERFPAATACAIPVAQLLVETDESRLPIDEILLRVAAARYGALPEKGPHFSGKGQGVFPKTAVLSPARAGGGLSQDDAFRDFADMLRMELEHNVRRLFGV